MEFFELKGTTVKIGFDMQKLNLMLEHHFSSPIKVIMLIVI